MLLAGVFIKARHDARARQPYVLPPLRPRRPRRHWRDVVRQRRARPLLSGLGIALAVQAAGLADLWAVVIPLGVGAWWWSPRDWPWSWLVPVGSGILGVAWGTAGAGLLRLFPGHIVLVGTLWAGAAAALACGAQLVRTLFDGTHGAERR